MASFSVWQGTPAPLLPRDTSATYATYLPAASHLPVASQNRPVRCRFGDRLRALRKRNRLTQTQLADYLGIDRSHISELENGHKNVSLTLLDVIAQGFHVSLSELLKEL